MTPKRHRMLNKVYIRTPGGEVQYGRVGKSITLWFRHRRYVIRKGRRLSA